MMERSSFSIEPNLEGQQADEVSKLYGQHLEDPSNPVPIEEAKKHYEENQEAYHNQAAMDMSAAGKDVNTSRITHNTTHNNTHTKISVSGGTFTGRVSRGKVNTDLTTTEDGVTKDTTVITGEHKGDLVIDMGKHPGGLRVEGAVIEGDLTIK
jgi:hypothetical protein